jgi:hypothetical protein
MKGGTVSFISEAGSKLKALIKCISGVVAGKDEEI